MKKTMRKSALLSSVAMLIVSAIVLTSATYAWFSASKTVNVTEITGSVQATTGLLISLEKDNVNAYGSSITVPSSAVPGSYFPVSTANGTTWVKGDYQDSGLQLTTFDVANAQANGVLTYTFYVKGEVGKTVNITPDFTGTDENVKKALKFAIVKEGENFVDNIWAGDLAANGYKGTSTAVTNGMTFENQAAFTVDGTSITERTTDSFSIADENPITFTAYVWLEGNDTDCSSNAIKSGNIKVSMSMSVAE